MTLLPGNVTNNATYAITLARPIDLMPIEPNALSPDNLFTVGGCECSVALDWTRRLMMHNAAGACFWRDQFAKPAA